MRFPALCLVFLLCQLARAQNFHYPVPDGWEAGEFAFPPEFAPSIAYKGQEYVRMAPNWREPGNENLWTYCFLWWIDGDATINEKTLEHDLKAYYDGLVRRNIVSRKIDSVGVVPTVVTIARFRHEGGFTRSFVGTVRMLDYLSEQPIVLNVRVHARTCEKQNRVAVLFQISPQSITHPVWEKLHLIRDKFICQK